MTFVTPIVESMLLFNKLVPGSCFGISAISVSKLYLLRGFQKSNHILYKYIFRGRIFSCMQPYHERAVSNLDRPMHISLWV